MSSRTRVLFALMALLAAIPLAWFIAFASKTCVGAWLRWDVEIGDCPDGEVHVIASVDANQLRRGQKGAVYVSADLVYVVGGALDVRRARLPALDVELSLVRGEQVTELAYEQPDDGSGKPDTRPVTNGNGRALLPAGLLDGDYLLRANVTTKAGTSTVEAPLAVYAPAKIFVVTDRPLYEPGHTVKMRAVVLRARDLVPLDKRPGRWVVTDARGVVVLEEKVDAGEYGVVEGELPLDQSSPVGVWHVRFESGGAVDDVTIDVKPFELPRFTVSVEPAKSFYSARDEPRLDVRTANAAGVPFAAELEVQWQIGGLWPPPAEWTQALPATARTDRSGRATLVIPRVPTDLIGKATVSAIVTARDDSGDQEVGRGTALLAEDSIDVALVTELAVPGTNGSEPGLVEGLNNRAYLRATTAAGVPLVGAELLIKRAWDTSDKGITVTTDEDGVAALQIDPGPAVNIVIPPLPVRLPPPPPLVQRARLDDLLDDDLPLGVIAAMDRLNASVGECARFAGDGGSVQVSVRVEPSGRIARAAAIGAAARCVGDALLGRPLPAGPPRILQVQYAFSPRLASLSHDVVGTGELPASVQGELVEALADARRCLGPLTVDAQMPRVIAWEIFDHRFSASLARDPEAVDHALDASRVSCVEERVMRALRDRTLGATRAPAGADQDDEADDGRSTSFGIVRLSVAPVRIDGAVVRAQATTMLGYELLVSARSGDEAVGKTKVRVRPGQIPSIRLRPSEVIAAPGDTITIDVLRGPSFEGQLPKKLSLTSADAVIESDVDVKTRSAKFTLPKEKDGWYEARFGEGIARVFVPRRTALAVEVAPDKRSYRPGETAKLAVKTSGSGVGISAAVGLIGVDDTLSQIVALPGPGAMERLATTVTMYRPAFDVLDATALALGRVRGKNAAAATVLLVSTVPAPAEIDISASATATTPFDPALPLADRFYTVLEDLYVVVRRFEQEAPKEEKLTPQKMLALWDDALAAAGKRGKETKDVFGRPMKLALLPDELVALTDPRLVVADGTRLPEDIEAWTRFVKTNGSKG